MISIKKMLVISLTASMLTILFIFFLLPADILSSLARIKPECLFIALCLQFLSWTMWSLRIKTLSRPVRGEIGFIEAMKTVLSSLFLACITPSQAGGEPVRIYLLKRNGMSVGGATAVVIGERALDVLFFAAAVPLSLYVFENLMMNRPVLRSIFLLSIFISIICIVILIYGTIKPEKIKKIIEKIAIRFLRKKHTFVDKIQKEVDNFHDAILNFRRREVFLGMGCTVLFWGSSFLIPSFILLGLDSDPVWLLSLAAQPLLTVIVMIPLTPGSSGVAELSAASLYAMFIPASIIGMFVAIWRFSTYYLNLFVSGIINLKILKDEMGKI
ncbi:MAG: lysylphosphatidylglycerol synthase transmembrane domain-containing protein [Candidatus Syntropharchaeia archaeon]